MSMRTANQSGQTAETLILVGLILQIIEVVILLGLGSFLLFVPILGGIIFGLGIIGIIWVLLVWAFSYRRTREGDYVGARTPTLVFGILSLISFGLISGILYIIAYVKLGDAMSSGSPTTYAWGSAPSPPLTAAGSGACPKCGAANPTGASFCSLCGTKLP